LDVDALELPQEVIVCDTAVNSHPYLTAFKDKEVDRICINRDQRRLDLRWGKIATPPRWRSLPRRLFLEHRIEAPQNLHVGDGEIDVTGREDESAVLSGGTIYMFADSDLAKLLRDSIGETERFRDQQSVLYAARLFDICGNLYSRGSWGAITVDEWRDLFERHSERARQTFDRVDFARVAEVLNAEQFKCFDASAWVRKEAP